jgi:hypothetical protein
LAIWCGLAGGLSISHFTRPGAENTPDGIGHFVGDEGWKKEMVNDDDGWAVDCWVGPPGSTNALSSRQEMDEQLLRRLESSF